MITKIDLKHLERCVELADMALGKGDDPFGSILVSGQGEVIAEARNRVRNGDETEHPELWLAKWAALNMTAEERAEATVYTSGEHCPMCSAAHAWVGLGRIVFASSAEQLSAWRKEMGLPVGRVRPLPIQDVICDTVVDGPADELAKRVKQLHFKAKEKRS